MSSTLRILVRDRWNTEILDALKPQPGDVAIYKTRFSGFYNTDLDAILKRRGVTELIMTGCTTSVRVESTIRDAMFRDYCTVLLSDCSAEPILPRSNHTWLPSFPLVSDIAATINGLPVTAISAVAFADCYGRELTGSSR